MQHNDQYANQALGLAPGYSMPNTAQLQAQPEQPLGSSIENIGIAANRLEAAAHHLESRLIGLRPELATAGERGIENVRPLALDARSHADRLHRVADALEKLHQQL